MRSFYLRNLLLALGAVCQTGVAWADNAASGPSLLPLPSVSRSYPTTAASHQVAWGGARYAADEPEATPPPDNMLQIHPHDPYLDASAAPWGAAGYGECAGGCETERCGSCWFGGVYGLIMNRDREDPVWLSFDSTDLSSALLGTPDAAMDWSGGFEVRVGRYFNCGQNAIEGIYWGIYPSVQEASALDPDGVPGAGAELLSTFAWGSLNYDDGVNPAAPVTAWFDNAMLHRLRRSYAFHNVELNLLGGNFNCCSYGSYCGDCCQPRMAFGWVAGVRYFQFGEGFEFAADEDDPLINGDVDELFYRVDVDNHLIGFQIGGNACYRLTNCLNFRADAKLGVYGSHITHSSFIGGANGAAIVTDPLSPYVNQEFNINSTKNDVAFVGELDLGGTYRISDHWSATFGYRAVAVSGVALVGEQVPMNFDDLGGVASIDSAGSLILHGGYAGVEFNY